MLHILPVQLAHIQQILVFPDILHVMLRISVHVRPSVTMLMAETISCALHKQGAGWTGQKKSALAAEERNRTAPEHKKQGA